MRPRKLHLSLLFSILCAATAPAQTYFTPLDFGLKPLPHGRIDYTHTPPDILVGNFNSDCYPDIARFEGDKLEIYVFQSPGYPVRPSSEKIFQQAIKSLRLDSFIWDNVDNLIATLADGTEDTLFHRGAGLDLEIPTGFLPQAEKQPPPRYVSEYDFQIVWESEPRPYGMDRCAVGDLDHDGINELVTYWKDSDVAADSAYLLVYKSIGDNQYELFMNTPLQFWQAPNAGVTQMLIADLDQNGQKEVIYTWNVTYFLEFSAPGVFTWYKSNTFFYRYVQDLEVCDVDQDDTLEIAFVTANYGEEPPCYYMVQEFAGKTAYGLNYNYIFLPIQNWWQDWEDDRLAVGDFDHDGAVDIVSGNAASVWSYDPVDIQYFRYDTTAHAMFTRNWLYTGIPLSCVTPVIEDLDGDGEVELFAGGLYPHGGSAYVWEATGFGTGYVAWLDTASLIFGPNESVFGRVDEFPAIGSVVIYWDLQDNSALYIFAAQDSQFSCTWQSGPLDSMDLHTPTFFDIDQDGRMNLAVASNIYGIYLPNKIFDWEQASAGIVNPAQLPLPTGFCIYPAYPNPFNSTIIIPYSLQTKSDLTFRVFDVAGREVLDKSEFGVMPGTHHWLWDAAGFPSGVYIIRLGNQIQKVMLLK